MPFAKIPRQRKHEALILEAQGHSQDFVADVVGISKRTIRRAKKAQRDYGDVEKHESQQRFGRLPKIGPLLRDVKTLDSITANQCRRSYEWSTQCQTPFLMSTRKIYIIVLK